MRIKALLIMQVSLEATQQILALRMPVNPMTAHQMDRVWVEEAGGGSIDQRDLINWL
jgi:hypothetical protein